MTPTPGGSPAPGSVATPDQPTPCDPTPPRTCEFCAPTPPDLTPRADGRREFLLCSLHTAELTFLGMDPAQRADYEETQRREYYPGGRITRPADNPLLRLLPPTLYYVTCPAELICLLRESLTP